MEAKLLKKLRKKYSSNYKICKSCNGWEVHEKSWYDDNYTYGLYYRLYSTPCKTKEEAMARVRKLVNSKIEEYLIEHRAIDVTSKMLYG